MSTQPTTTTKLTDFLETTETTNTVEDAEPETPSVLDTLPEHTRFDQTAVTPRIARTPETENSAEFINANNLPELFTILGETNNGVETPRFDQNAVAPLISRTSATDDTAEFNNANNVSALSTMFESSERVGPHTVETKTDARGDLLSVCVECRNAVTHGNEAAMENEPCDIHEQNRTEPETVLV